MAEYNGKTLETGKVVEKDNKDKGFYHLLFYVLLLAVILTIMIAMLTMGIRYVLNSYNEHIYYNRVDLYNQIKSAVKNDADLDVVKVIYRDRYLLEGKKFGASNDKLYYKESVPLTTVLEDMLARAYVDDNSKPEYIEKLSIILSEQKVLEPFDGLSSEQRDLFEQLKIIAGDEYERYEITLGKLSEEVEEQNNLVVEYLAKSEASYRLSVIALLIGVTLPTVQIMLSVLLKRARSAKGRLLGKDHNESDLDKTVSDSIVKEEVRA